MLRPLVAADLVAAQALTAGFGWPHRLEDWAFMARHGEGLALELGGRLVGTGMTCRFGPDHAALGLVGVEPGHQGRGLGRQLMQGLLDGVGGRTVILHATPAGAPLYQSFGFVGQSTVRQWQGVVTADAWEAGPALRPIGPDDHAAVAGLDAAATGLRRGALLRELLQEPGGLLLEAGDGFALQRHFGRGRLIGPVAAVDAAGARALIGSMLAGWVGRFVRVDVPEEAGLDAWLAGFGLADVGPGLRMVRGTPPRLGFGGVRMQAMMSQALG